MGKAEFLPPRTLLAEVQRTRPAGSRERGDNPIAERARFLAIVTSNLTEFISVQVAGLIRSRHENSRDYWA